MASATSLSGKDASILSAVFSRFNAAMSLANPCSRFRTGLPALMLKSPYRISISSERDIILRGGRLPTSRKRVSILTPLPEFGHSHGGILLSLHHEELLILGTNLEAESVHRLRLAHVASTSTLHEHSIPDVAVKRQSAIAGQSEKLVLAHLNLMVVAVSALLLSLSTRNGHFSLKDVALKLRIAIVQCDHHAVKPLPLARFPIWREC